MLALRFLAFLAFAACCAQALAAVTVAFPDPESFHDASLRDGYRATADEPALREIDKHLRKLGERFLDPASSLQVEVLDVDLAGRFEPWRPNLHGVRIMNSLTWPSITLRYTLLRDGAVEAAGEERIIDQMYLARPRTWFASERLGYEKQMLDDWFRLRFVAPSR